MKYARDMLTIEEILSTNKETLDTIFDVTAYDQKPGDLFFIKDKPDKILLIEELAYIDDKYYLVYHGGERVYYDDTYPLFTSGNLIDMLQFLQPIDLRSFGHGWLLLFDNEHIYASEEDEILVSFLWRVLKDLAAKKLIH